MQKQIVLLLLISTLSIVGGQTCVDIPPDTTFPCAFYFAIPGGCDAPYDDLKDDQDNVVFCLVTCGLCDQFGENLNDDVQSTDIIEQLQQGGGNFAAAEGEAVGVGSLVEQVQSNFTSAVATLPAPSDTTCDDTTPIVEAAVSTTQAVSTSIAQAMARVELRGATGGGENSVARGQAQAQAEAVAIATAEAYSVAIAEAGDEFTELEASTLTTDVQNALAQAAADFSISGNTQVTIVQEAYATVVAEAVANATARAFAKIVGCETTAIALATAQAFNSSQLTCFSFCNVDPPPTETRTCSDIVADGECPTIPGFCECACRTCSVGSQASVSTFIELIASGNTEQTVNAFGEAFASGAAGADAVATAVAQAVAQGEAEAVSNAIAEAFGVQDISASALAESIAEAINQGGEEVVQACADAFALAAQGGSTSSLAQAISTALTSTDGTTAQAITTALSAAIADGNCEAISAALVEAQAIAEDEGSGDAFSAGVATSDAVNNCLQGSDDASSSSTADTYVATSASGNAEAVGEAIAVSLQNNDVTSSAETIVQAVSEGRSSAVATGLAIAMSNGAEASAIAETIATAIALGDGTSGVVEALGEAIALAENSNAEALAEVIAEGLAGSQSSTFAQALSEAVSEQGCDAIATSLSSAQSLADSRGNGDSFAASLSESVATCLGGGGIAIVDTIAEAVANGDSAAIASVAADAFANGQVEAFVAGLAQAAADGVGCDAIVNALVDVSAFSQGQEDALLEAVGDASAVSSCVSGGFSDCRGSIARDCCTDYPDECVCTFRSCRATKNLEFTVESLGLYVYNDVGNRQCKC